MRLCRAGPTVINDISDREFRPNPGRKKRDRDGFFDWMHGKWHDIISTGTPSGVGSASGTFLKPGDTLKPRSATLARSFRP